MADENQNELAEFGLGQISNTEVQDALAACVNRRYNEARDHKRRIGVTNRLLRNLRAKKCEYQPEEQGLLATGVDIYIGIAALKAAAAESWLLDIIVNNIDKPWTLSSTPEPDLPQRLKEQVIDALVAELPQMRTFDALKDRATQLKSVVQGLSKKAAQEATKRMETRIDDQLTEGGWVKTFTALVGDISVYPTAMIRGPIQIAKPQMSWDGNKVKVENKAFLTTRNVNPFNAYPAPNATTTQDGTYFIEAVPFTYGDLHELTKAKSFSSANIRQALHKYPDGYMPNYMEDNEERELEGKSELLSNRKDFEVVIYNGKMEGKLLADKGVLVKDLQKHYECEIWCVENYVIRAVLNPNPTGGRPIFGSSYRKVNNSFWGKSVIDLVYDVQRTCNAAARAIVRNMGYASGPVGEVVSERLAPGDDITELEPYKIFRVGPDITGTGAPAFRFHNITAIVKDLMAVFERFSKMADDISGIPAYVLGNPQVAGAGRTLGGLSMLMGNAAKGIKNVQMNIDEDIITGVVKAFYTYNMLTSDDNGIKADAKVVARGATGLLQRELSQTRSVELLQLLTPYVQAGLVDKSALTYILRDIFQNTGMNIDKIFPDPDRAQHMQQIAKLLSGDQAEAMERGSSQPVSLPPQSQPPANLAPFPRPANLAQGS